MEPLAVGVSFRAPRSPAEQSTLLDACWSAVALPAWNKPLRFLSVQVLPGKFYPRRDGVVASKQREHAVRAMLMHGDVWAVIIASSARTEDRYGKLVIETRPQSNAKAVSVYGRQWIVGDPSRQDAWVSGMLDFAEQMGVGHGVIPVMPDSAVFSEGGLVGALQNGRLLHPFPQEFRRMQSVEQDLGTKYVRFPRWGTIYSREHIEQLGGVDHIREVVRPAVIRDLGPNAVYFQLTESVATAISDEVLEKQRLFTELAESLLPPPLLGEPSEAPDLSWLMEAAQNLGKEPPVTSRKRREPVAGRKVAEAAGPADAERQPAGLESPEEESTAADGEPTPEPFF